MHASVCIAVVAGLDVPHRCTDLGIDYRTSASNTKLRSGLGAGCFTSNEYWGVMKYNTGVARVHPGWNWCARYESTLGDGTKQVWGLVSLLR